jgi:hypothetical protein
MENDNGSKKLAKIANKPANFDKDDDLDDFGLDEND